MDLSSVADTALWLSKACFWVFVVLSVIEVYLKFRKTDVVPQAAGVAANAPAGVDPSKIIEAAAKLAEALAKAGPALSALVASILFLSIAAVSVGTKEVVNKPTPPAPAAAQTPPSR
jgi:hypothetical protein